MVDMATIQTTCDDIARRFSPRKIVLFGSYAYGRPTPDSDVDLLVVMDVPTEETRRKGLDIYLSLPSRFPIDLLVRTPSELAWRMANNDCFIRDILQKGRVMYETTDAGMGAKG